jgi:predicted nucleotidyltransferase
VIVADKIIKTDLNSRIASSIERLVKTLPGLIAVYLHGSAAKGKVRPDSDLDFALLFEHEEIPDAKQLFIIKPEIEEAAGRTVDLGILSTENPVFAKEVISNGNRLFCKDVHACEQFKMYVFSFYGKLNDERKKVLDSYQTNA